MKGKLIWIIILLAGIAGAWFLWKNYTRPLVGEEIPALGRDHVTDISSIEYNSNPPTSGSHFPVWAKKGVYDRVLSDGYLIHSLEHGYVVVSYNCDGKVISTQETVLRKEGAASSSAEATASAAPLHVIQATAPFTPASPPPVEVNLSDNFNSNECKALVNQLSDLTKVADRVIVVPRPQLDTKIALTAWTRILKMDSLDADKAKEFINDFHNRGPEKTME